MLSNLVPGPLVRWFARPYVAGDSMQAGLDLADELRGQEIRTTLDLLGEDVSRAEQVEANVATYEGLIDAIASDERFGRPALRPSVSLKPSGFTTGEIGAARDPLVGLAERAHQKGVALTIDMEDRRWTDFTIGLTVDLFRRGFDVGTVFQTRLDRTESDLEKIPEGMRLRLVIGIYPEPVEVAVTDKRVMKARLVEYAAKLLDRGVFVEYGSHDEEFAERFVREVAPKAPERCEIQMLLGVPRARFRRGLAAGEFGPKLPFRLYVPFAKSWEDATAYLRRRMVESPSVAWLVLRNLFSTQARR